MTAPAQPSNTSETIAGASPTPPPTGQPWRAGPNADPRLAGKTADEILGIASMALGVLEKFNQPTPAPQPQPGSRFDLDLQDEDYVQGKDVKRILAQQQAPVDMAARHMAAQTVWGLVQVKRADEFKRWGPEINLEVQKLPVEHWSLDNLNIIVDIVKSRHVEELAAETAQRLINEAHPTIRSGTGGSGSGPLTTQRTLADDSLPQDWVARARNLGITEQTIREFCEMTGQTPDQYLADVERYGKGAVIGG